MIGNQQNMELKKSRGNAVATDESKMVESIPFSKEVIEALEKIF